MADTTNAVQIITRCRCGHPVTVSIKEATGTKKPECDYCKAEREHCETCTGNGCDGCPACTAVSLAIRRQEEAEARAEHYREMGWVR